jgi:plasmid stabilization system protein ParE
VKVKFLKQAQEGLVWWHGYYRKTFPAGRSSAYKQFSRTKALLKENPYAGNPVGVGDLRKLVIINTPFVLFYRVSGQTIEIVQIRDARGEPDPGFHEDQARITA